MKNLVLYGVGSLCLVSILGVSEVFAHGEDAPGPHGGIVRMPGAYHTELLPVSETAFRVYLLDMNFEEPVTEDSSIHAVYEGGSEKTEITCSPVEDYFQCQADAPLVKGKVLIGSQREGSRGSIHSYDLPLEKPHDHQ